MSRHLVEDLEVDRTRSRHTLATTCRPELCSVMRLSKHESAVMVMPEGGAQRRWNDRIPVRGHDLATFSTIARGGERLAGRCAGHTEVHRPPMCRVGVRQCSKVKVLDRRARSRSRGSVSIRFGIGLNSRPSAAPVLGYMFHGREVIMCATSWWAG